MADFDFTQLKGRMAQVGKGGHVELSELERNALITNAMDGGSVDPEEVQELIDESLEGYYNKFEVDSELNTKSDKADTYTKTEVDTALSNITTKDVGYFSTLSALETSYPSPTIGMMATVGAKFEIYKCATAGVWASSGDYSRYTQEAVTSLPSNPDTHTIYALQGESSWTEQIYSNGSWVVLATHSGASVEVDEMPIEDSANAVSSGGMYKTLTEVELSNIDSNWMPLTSDLEHTGSVSDKYTYKYNTGKHYAIPVSSGDVYLVRSSEASFYFVATSAYSSVSSNVNVSTISQSGGNAVESTNTYIKYVTCNSSAAYLILSRKTTGIDWNVCKVGESYTPTENTDFVFTNTVGMVNDITQDGFEISDGNGNSVLRIVDGHIKTQKFDSESAVTKPTTNYPNVYWGEKISLKRHGYSINNICTLSSSSSATRQASCSYGNYVLQFQTDGTICIYNLSSSYYTSGLDKTVSPIQSLSIDYNHPGQAQFGYEYYDSSDMFPLLYVSHGNTTDSVISVYRISGTEGEWGISLVQTITIPNDASTFMTNIYAMVDNDRKLLVILGLSAAYSANLSNTYKVTTFPLPTLSQGNVVYTTSNASEIYTVGTSLPVPQCGFCIADRMYIIEGGNNQARMDVIDYIGGKIVTTMKLVDIGITSEPEGVIMYKEKLLFIMANGRVYEINTDY